ncbi:MAG: HAD family hydrolase [Verrucomicrobiota bacterium]
MVAAPFSVSKTVLFDLDGTLIDHFTTIYRCYRHAQETLGLEPASYEKVRTTVGGSVPITMQRLVGEGLANRAVELFKEHYRDIWEEDLHAMPGAVNILKGLHTQGKELALFTNKGGESSRHICEHLGFTPYLNRVFGTGDTPWRKPQPEFTHHVMVEMKAYSQTTVMVGDSPWDIAAASNEHIPCLVVATGSHSLDELRKHVPPPAGAYRDLTELGREAFGLNLHADKTAPTA